MKQNQVQISKQEFQNLAQSAQKMLNEQFSYMCPINKRMNIASLGKLYTSQFRIQKRVHILNKTFDVWRKIKEDGNSFYRAIGLNLLEHFIRMTTPLNEFDQFIQQLKSQQGYFRDIGATIQLVDEQLDSQEVAKRFVCFLERIRSFKNENKIIQAFQQLESDIQTNIEVIDICLV